MADTTLASLQFFFLARSGLPNLGDSATTARGRSEIDIAELAIQQSAEESEPRSAVYTESLGPASTAMKKCDKIFPKLNSEEVFPIKVLVYRLCETKCQLEISPYAFGARRRKSFQCSQCMRSVACLYT